MNIGFYGHSATCWYGNPISFIDQVKKHFNATIVNIGVPQGSEERILFNLKKTKSIDVAVIFHAPGPRYTFLPKCNRDISVGSIPENKAKVLWSEDNEDNLEVDKIEFEKEFFSYGKIKEVFGDTDTFVDCMNLYRQFLYHPDLCRNRYEGARSLIDIWCSFKVPKVIHVIDYEQKHLPPWFKFTSGIVSDKLRELLQTHTDGNVKNINNISNVGNELIANEIIEIIKSQKWDS